MATSDLYCRCARVWLPHAAQVWRSAQLLRGYTPGDVTLAVQLDDGTVVDYTLDPQTRDLPPLRNPDLLVGANDLAALSFLHEAAVLHSLRTRFIHHRLIYTYCGNVLVAINPFEELPIYGADSISAYSGHNMADVPPHIFAVAEEAYRQLGRGRTDQSIVVSGESGAGKTVSAKYAMRYFAAVSCSSDVRSSCEERVVACSPVLEALGNAKTSRNDNSSRFGKFIEIGFDQRLRVSGANIRTYLLEKSRVVFQAHGERNYHIFYQLCTSSHLPEFGGFQLGGADEFECTRQGQCAAIDLLDDAKEMCNTRRAFSQLGISEADQMDIYRVVAALLHLSNVEVKHLSADRSWIEPENTHLMVFCDLMGVSAGEMAHWLCHRKLETKTETCIRCVSKPSAVSGRDALAKHIYARLFSHVVSRINEALRPAERRCCVAVLDIYGFETFDFNSFEQFCINYANEKLQQQFNQLVFKLEQEEYKKEEIPWILIDYYDNKPCIDLIEAKLGVLDLLDDECKLLSGTDDSWAQKMYSSLLRDSSHFTKPKLSNRAFIINHFAGRVEYQCEGFVEKNKDTVNEEQIAVLKKSSLDLLLKLFEEDVTPPNTSSLPPAAGQRRRTAGLQFRDSLRSLMDMLNNTTPHYVRCIKSNDHKAPFALDPVRAAQQLRACGILQTIQISAAGFPSRWTYQDFFSRYGVLMKKKEVLLDRKQTCKNLLGSLIKDQSKYQFGKSKIFLRAGQVAHLERLRSERLRAASVLIQKTLRCWLTRQSYLRLRRCVVTIQRHERGRRARSHAAFLRRSRAAVVLQQNVRMWTSRKRYQQQRSAAVCIQSCFRAHRARKRRRQLMLEQTAVLIQRWVRGWLVRQRLKHTRTAVVLLQCCVRRMKARRELKRLKVEADSVERFKKLNAAMELKIRQLQRAMSEQQKENRELSEKLGAVEKKQSMKRQRDGEETRHLHRSEQEARAEAETLQQLCFLQQQLDNTCKEKLDLEKQLATHKQETKQVLEELHVRNSSLNSEKEELNKLILQQAQQLAELHLRAEQMEKDLADGRSASLTCRLHLQPLGASDQEVRQQEVPPLRSHMGRQDARGREDAEVDVALKMSSRHLSTDILSCDEDEELWQVYESLKDTGRRLERQMQAQDRFHHQCYTNQLQQVNKLRDVSKKLLSHRHLHGQH